jgi:YfiH family protein
MTDARPPSVFLSKKLTSISGITHGFTTKQSGDMRKKKNRDTLLQLLRILPASLLQSQQIHGSHISVVRPEEQGIIHGCDGLVAVRTVSPSKALASRVADCIPVLITDTNAQMIAAVHAGWRGTYEKIVLNAIEHFFRAGIKKENIIVALGPHIGGCCYTVSPARMELFFSRFGKDPEMGFLKNTSWHLDLGYVNIKQLCDAGIPQRNIDADFPCTFENSDILYSYRKESKSTFGETMGVIGFN